MSVVFKFTVFLIFVFHGGVNGNDTDADDESYYWRDYKGRIPKDALPGGTNENGSPTYIGQVLHGTLLIPAKIDPDKNQVAYEWGYKEYITSINIKILCTKHPEDFEWLNTAFNIMQNINPDILLEAGYEPGAKMYVGRKQLGKELALGKVIKGSNQSTLNTTKDGVGTQHSEFSVLSYNPKRRRNTTNKDPPREVLDIDTRIGSTRDKGGSFQYCSRVITINLYSS